MKCPKCGFVSYNYLNTCKRCGYDLGEYKAKLGIKTEAAPPASAQTPTPESSTPAESGTGIHGQLFDKLQQEFAKRKDERRHAKEETDRRTAERDSERIRREAQVTARREAERVAREETAKLRQESERAIQAQVERILERTQHEAQAQAESMRIEAERAAREAAERVRREAEEKARIEAEVMRAESERMARESAELVRKQAEAEAMRLRELARREAEKMLVEAERVAVDQRAHARAIADAARDTGLAPLQVPENLPAAVDESRLRVEFEDHRVETVPSAEDLIEILSQKAARETRDDHPSRSADAPDAPARDFPAPDADAAYLRSAYAREVVQEEYEVRTDAEDDRGAAGHVEVRIAAMDTVERGGLIVRAVGGLLDTALLLIIVCGFLLVGVGAFAMGESSLGSAGLARLAGPIYLLFLLISACYVTFFIGSSGQTPGMMVFGLKVVTDEGESVGYARAFVRMVASIFSLCFFGLGHIAVALDPDRQGWHDRLAQCVVVRL
ncbi:MAG: RDD family protein [Deltaproteobacteria bacterium]|nr:RDD family protein [Deltaproteobacteria bacterium]